MAKTKRERERKREQANLLSCTRGGEGFYGNEQIILCLLLEKEERNFLSRKGTKRAKSFMEEETSLLREERATQPFNELVYLI